MVSQPWRMFGEYHPITKQIPAFWFCNRRAGRKNQLWVTWIEKYFNGRFQGCSGKACLCKNRKDGLSGDLGSRIWWAVISAHSQGESALTMGWLQWREWVWLVYLGPTLTWGGQLPWLMPSPMRLGRVSDSRKEVECCYQQEKDWILMSAVPFYLKWLLESRPRQS